MAQEDVALLQAPLLTTPSIVTLSPSAQSHDCLQDLSEQQLASAAMTPSHILAPSLVAIWKILGLEPITNNYHPSTLYLRAGELPDPGGAEPPVERVLFNDKCDDTTDVSDRQGRLERKRKKSKHYR